MTPLAKRIDILNIALIFLALTIAVYLPFKLFLLAYAFLGPLHYLTEISWLRDKNYFIKSSRKWGVLFLVITIIVSIKPIFDLTGFQPTEPLKAILNYISGHIATLILTAFIFAIGLILFRETYHLIIALVASLIIAYFMATYLPMVSVLMGIFIPSLIHVYVFTLLFILYGAIKSKSKYGYLTSMVLLLVPVIVYYLPINQITYNPSESTINNFKDSGLGNISSGVAWVLNGFENQLFAPLSTWAIKIQIFITFAYTYHYLNWFSKTSIIGWRKSITKQRSIWILGIWLVSISIYIYDFKTGFIALFALSLLHVLLEFPLNMVSTKALINVFRSK